MASKTKKAGGLKYAEGVEPAKAGSDQAIAAMLKKKGKIRITTMIDEDVLDALKARAASEGDGRYQTFLNTLLRQVLLGGRDEFPDGSLKEHIEELVHAEMDKRQARMDQALERVRALLRKIESNRRGKDIA